MKKGSARKNKDDDTELYLHNQLSPKIRKLIMRGTWPIEAQVILEEIPELCGIKAGMVSIRRALVELSMDGIVDIRPHSGTYVSKFSEKDVNDIRKLTALVLNDRLYDVITAKRGVDTEKLSSIVQDMRNQISAAISTPPVVVRAEIAALGCEPEEQRRSQYAIPKSQVIIPLIDDFLAEIFKNRPWLAKECGRLFAQLCVADQLWTADLSQLPEHFAGIVESIKHQGYSTDMLASKSINGIISTLTSDKHLKHPGITNYEIKI